MRLNDLVNELRNRLNDNNAEDKGEYADEDLIKYINEALSWFCRVLKCITTTDETENNSTYINLNNVIEPYLVVASTDTENFVCVKKDKRDLDDLYLFNVTGDPKYFYVNNGKVYLFPKKANTQYHIICNGYGIEELKEYADESYVVNKFNLTPFMDACEFFARKSRPTVDNNLNLMQVAYQNVIAYFNEQGRISNV